LLTASTALANSFCRGVAQKTSLPCSLKIKEMIMPGIMSEGSDRDTYAQVRESGVLSREAVCRIFGIDMAQI
jgi:hypothetical protein